jgi:hypothetical protein
MNFGASIVVLWAERVFGGKSSLSHHAQVVVLNRPLYLSLRFRWCPIVLLACLSPMVGT